MQNRHAKCLPANAVSGRMGLQATPGEAMLSGQAAATASGLISGNGHVNKDEFEALVARAAGGLQAAGLRQGECVAILMRNDIPFLVASLAAIRLGAYAVPINWHFAADEVGYVMRTAKPKFWLVTRIYWRRAQARCHRASM